MCRCFLCKEDFEEIELRIVDLDGEQKIKICDFCYEAGMDIENNQYDQSLTEVFC